MPPQSETHLSHSQNFIRDPRLVDYLLDRSNIGIRDLVYEIGPGAGVITERLARRCRRVVAVEKDTQLAAHLCRRFETCPNVTIRHADFLQVPLPPAPYKVFANIPYAITAAIVTRLVTHDAPPLDSYLVVQREAADRFTGSPRGTLYAALLLPWFAASIVHRFRPTDFRPVPRVESVLLRLCRRDRPLIPAADGQFFRDFVAHAFTAPSPCLLSTLRACLGRPLADRILRTSRLDPTATPSMVPGTLWLLLFEHLKDAGGARARDLIGGAEERLRAQQAGLHKMHRTRLRAPLPQVPQAAHHHAPRR